MYSSNSLRKKSSSNHSPLVVVIIESVTKKKKSPQRQNTLVKNPLPFPVFVSKKKKNNISKENNIIQNFGRFFQKYVKKCRKKLFVVVR